MLRFGSRNLICALLYESGITGSERDFGGFMGPDSNNDTPSLFDDGERSPPGGCVTKEEADRLNMCPDVHTLIEPGTPRDELASHFMPGRFGSGGGIGTSERTETASSMPSAELRDRILLSGATERAAWNDSHLSFDCRVTLDPRAVALANEVTEVARSLFGEARRSGERFRDANGMDHRVYGAAMDWLQARWSDLFKEAGDFGFPSHDAIVTFRGAVQEEIGKVAARGGYMILSPHHALRQVAQAGAALESLYNVHDHLLFDGIFTAARTLDASVRLRALKTNDAFAEVASHITEGTPFAARLSGKRLTEKMLADVSNAMARVPEFDHPKVTALCRILHNVGEEHIAEGVLILGGGGIESQRLAEQLLREFPDEKISVIHGKTSQQKREEILGKFNRGEISILITDTVTQKGITLGKTPALAVVYSSPRIREEDAKMIPLGTFNLRFVEALPPS